MRKLVAGFQQPRVDLTGFGYQEEASVMAFDSLCSLKSVIELGTCW
jgi:hypothetical protein